MGSRQEIRVLLVQVAEALRGYLLIAFLAGLYFVVLTPTALVWRWVLRRSLFRARGGWIKVNEATDTPDLFSRSA